jgi:SecY interacting protein Syd
MSDINQHLSALVEKYQLANPRLEQEYDPEWRSPCETGEPYLNAEGERVIAWVPKVRTPSKDFSGYENALDTEVHADIKAFYARYWAGNIETSAEEGHVSLIQLWNFEDIDRLMENQLGHAFAQKQSRSPLSIFIANTEPESELFITVRNSDGVVQLEKPGYKPIKEISGSLGAFLNTLEPCTPDKPL